MPPPTATMGLIPRVACLLATLLSLLPLVVQAGASGPGPRGSRDYLAEMVEIYKVSLERLLPIYEANLRRRSDLLNQAAALYGQRKLPFKEVEGAARLVTEAREQLAETRRDIHRADLLVVESRGRRHLGELGRGIPGAYQVGRGAIRYLGTAHWSLTDLGTVERFFHGRFRQALPVTAVGQTSIHDRLGFDHREAVDVAVHPDSPEGSALMTYLRSRKIPFIAYREAVTGVATGAHVHIGAPSERLEDRR